MIEFPLQFDSIILISLEFDQSIGTLGGLDQSRGRDGLNMQPNPRLSAAFFEFARSLKITKVKTIEQYFGILKLLKNWYFIIYFQTSKVTIDSRRHETHEKRTNNAGKQNPYPTWVKLHRYCHDLDIIPDAVSVIIQQGIGICVILPALSQNYYSILKGRMEPLTINSS